MFIDSRFMYRYIYIHILEIYIYLYTKRESKHLFRLPFVGHGIPWKRAKIRPLEDSNVDGDVGGCVCMYVQIVSMLSVT